MLPTTKSARAKPEPASAAMSRASGKRKPPRVRPTRNITTMTSRSSTPKAALEPISRPSDRRYCAWLRICARTIAACARITPSATLHHQPALAAALHQAAQREHDHGPGRLQPDQNELPRQAVPLGHDVERDLDDRRDRRRD